MKLLNTKTIKNAVFGAVLMAAPAAALSSCDHFNEDLEPCPQGVELRFVYDYNMEFSNAFPSQVECLTVYIYDGEGRYIDSRVETGSVLKDENWRMKLDLPAGEYSFVAYGGMACDKASFSYLTSPVGAPMHDLGVKLNASLLTSPVGSPLHPLFYGRLESVTVTDADIARVPATVYMMKDTNNIRILLQNVNGTPVVGSDYIFTITDNNTVLNWNNDVVPQPQATVYHPWTQGDIAADENQVAQGGITAFAEFDTSRLTLSTSPTLSIVRASDGANVLTIPLINYLIMLKSEHFAGMTNQEFLDRESRWDMIFFIGPNATWIQTSIIINGWVVRINDISTGF